MPRPLLVGSLVVNAVLLSVLVWLWFSVRTPVGPEAPARGIEPGAMGEAAAASAGAAGLAVAGADGVPAGFDWSTATPEDIMGELRRVKAPLSVLVGVASGLADERFRERIQELRSPGDRPRWRHSRPVQLTAEERAEEQGLREQQQAEFRRLLGPDHPRVYSEGLPEGARQRFGDLPPETIARVVQIENDYSRIRAGQARGVDAGSLLEREMAKDLAVVLTPEEVSDYLTFNSPFARRLQDRLQRAELTDEAYRGIYDAAAQFRSGFWANDANANVPEQAAAYRLPELTHLRQTVASDILTGVALQQDRDFQTIMRTIAQADAAPETVLAKYEAYLGFLKELDEIPSHAQSQAETFRLGQPAARRVYEALTADLDEAARGRFQQTPLGRNLARFLEATE